MFRGGEEKTELPPGGQESKSPARSTAAAREGVANPAGRAPKSRIRPLEKPEGQKPDPAAKAMAEAMMEDMNAQHAKRAEARIAELTEALGLDAAQAAKLREFFESRAPQTAVSIGEDGGMRIESKREGQTGSLDELMKGLLTPEQAEPYERLKETERNQRIEARTLREMATLTQAVGLRPEQRDAAYAILQEEASNDAGSGFQEDIAGIGMLMPAMGLEESGGPGSVMATRAVQLAEGGAVQEEALEQMRRQEQAGIEAKVERMRGVLDEAQLAKYRERLQQGSLLFGP